MRIKRSLERPIYVYGDLHEAIVFQDYFLIIFRKNKVTLIVTNKWVTSVKWIQYINTQVKFILFN